MADTVLLAALTCVGILGAGVAAGEPAGVHYLSYAGTAAAHRSPGFLYGEQHVLEYRGPRLTRRVVLYTCRDGAAFARKTVSYVDDFAPDFTLEDVSNGLTEGVRSEGGSRVVFFRAGRDEPERSRPLAGAPGLVADAGFDEFVHAHWPALMSGQELTMRFLVPSRLKDIGFQVAHLRTDRWEGVPTEVFRLKLSGLWGYLLPGIDVYYRSADRVMVRYVGLSNLRNAARDNLQAEITYRDADRRTADAGLFDGARLARLTPCARRAADP
jgi:hypothetical protein